MSVYPHLLNKGMNELALLPKLNQPQTHFIWKISLWVVTGEKGGNFQLWGSGCISQSSPEKQKQQETHIKRDLLSAIVSRDYGG